MEKLNFDDVFKKANETYIELKKKKHPYQAPEIFEGIVMSSDSIKAILHVLLDSMNAMIDEHNKANPAKSITFVDEDFETPKKKISKKKKKSRK